MSQNPFLLLLMIGGGLYIGKLWRDDLRSAAIGESHPQALPGATPCTRRALVTACLGSIVLLAGETWGEYRLGVVTEQSNMTVLFALNSLVAPIIEETIFRGYLVINGRGHAVRWLGIVVASALFALLHPFLWVWEDGLVFTLTIKGAFSTIAAFAFSLWFYHVRFARWNSRHSLLPCFAAHGMKNLGVIVIKAVQGFLTGWW
ncbi:MAG: CPBP family intramembrane metalloprotease [Cephaloticoccus sp.]|nr:CPBP family intramembrane metalloprotease [Cephaloticoccus sp.]MCF7760580.1 CPBP family intramembrane metalloprotease [Cephaloticoccus sp.]